MPLFRLETNVPKSKIPADFLTATCALIAKVLKKPENYCVATVVPDTVISWCATNETCGIATLTCIGGLGVEENKIYAKAIHDHLEKTLGIPNSRLYIHFVEASASHVGYQGTTFHELHGVK